jgi:N-acetylmuramoyl-L-alanine amidase
LLLPVALGATEPVFHKVDVREGDGIYSLLRRYDLGDPVSLSKFYELNRLDQNAHLVIGNDYFLPILVYQYDGKSIRSTIGIDNWDLAVRIAQFNRTLQERGLRSSSYESSKVLWVPYRELNGSPAPISEASPTESPNVTMRIPLFGASDETISIRSQELKGKVFYVISGHGGPDPGAISETGGHTLCEDEYAYDVSLRLARNLMEHGAIVEVVVQDQNDGIRDSKYLACDKDEVTVEKKEIPLNQLLRLQQRVHNVNTLAAQYSAEGFKDQTVICIHVDSQNPSARRDVYFYYFEESEGGKNLAYSLQETFHKKYHQNRAGRGYTGTVSCRSLYVLKHTNPKAVYVELANIKNGADLKRILPESNRQALANWLFEGLKAAVLE